jgi:hypothetical protein
MADTTDIEKKSLEAHVELCAERYKLLELKLETVESTVTSLKEMIVDLHDMVHKMSEKRNDQLFGWGIGLIGALVATVGWLLSHYVFK